MMEIWLSIVFAGLFTGHLFATAQPPSQSATYILLLPSCTQPGRIADVYLDLIKPVGPCDVIVELYNVSSGVRVANTRDIIQNGNPMVFSVQVPADLPPLRYSRGFYNISVKGICQNFAFTKDARIEIRDKPSNAPSFIQSDKPIYQPGETVHYRAFSLDSQLKLINAVQNVSLEDSIYHVIRDEKGVSDPSGIIRGNIKFPDDVQLGTYSIRTRDNGIAQFEVSKYVKPRIDLEVKLPPWLTINQKSVAIEISARYPFNERVRGNVLVTFTAPPLWVFPRKPAPQMQRSIREFDSKAVLNILMEDVRALNKGAEFFLHVEVNFTESLTGEVISTKKKIAVYEADAKLLYLSGGMTSIIKPGIPTIQRVKVVQNDWSPFTGNPNKITVEILFSHPVNTSRGTEMRTTKLTPFEIAASRENIAEINIPDFPKYTQDVAIISKYGRASFPMRFVVAQSSSGRYIHVDQTMGDKEVGTIETFSIISTFDFDSFNWLITSNGRVVNTAEEKRSTKSRKHTISTFITDDMIPEAVLVVYTLMGGEVISSSTKITVLNSFKNEVSAAFNTDVARPGEEVTLTVQTAPHSLVSTYARSDILDGQDVPPTPKLDYYLTNSQKFRCINGEGFEYSQMNLFSDIPFTPLPLGKRTSLSNMFRSNLPTGVTQKHPYRTVFPESWLFTVKVADSNGIANITAVVPDVIANWDVLVYSFNTKKEFGINAEPAKLKVFKPILVNMALPNMVMQDEELFLQVDVTNKLTSTQTVDVTLSGSDSYKSLAVDGTGGVVLQDGARTQTITVTADSTESVIFPVRAVKVGDASITVTAISSAASDSVTKTLKVEPDGFEFEYNFIEFVNLTENGTYQATRDITYPLSVVDGTQQVEIRLTGDVLGLTLANIPLITQMPLGSGEQSMLTFTPAVLISDYLKSIGKWTLMRDRIKTLTLMGYQRQMVYKEFVGDYSVFGHNNSDASLWLTAYVAKYFAIAREDDLVPFDFDQFVVRNAFSYITRHQKDDGSFEDKGSQMHKVLQGRSGNRNALTAYVLTALLTYNSSDGAVQNATEYATEFVENYVVNTTDVYELAIGVYALALAGSSRVDSVLGYLESEATLKDGYRFWEIEAEQKYIWLPPTRKARPASIEATSYVCMVYAMRRDLTKSKQCLNWLTSQLNHYGGLVSSQDTVLALQAIARIAPLFHTAHQRGHISVEAGGQSVSFNINDGNKLDLQEATLPQNTGRVSVRGTGPGLLLLSISAKFRTNSEILQRSFSLFAYVSRDTHNVMGLTVCTAYVRGESSNMAIIEIYIPPDFQLTDKSKNDLSKTVKNVDSQDGKVLLYLDQITRKGLCLTLLMAGKGNVNHVKQRAVRVFDAYNPGDSAVAFYRMKSTDGDFCQAPFCTRDSTGCALNCQR